MPIRGADVVVWSIFTASTGPSVRPDGEGLPLGVAVAVAAVDATVDAAADDEGDDEGAAPEQAASDSTDASAVPRTTSRPG